MTFNPLTVTQMETVDLLVAFTDLTGFLRLMQREPDPQKVAQLVDTHFEIVGDAIAQAGGVFVKCLGDGTLSVFPEAQVDAAVAGLQRLKEQSDHWFSDQGYDCPLRIALHFGPVACGHFGPRDDKRFDILGHTVNTAVTLTTYDISLTPQVFRKLSPASRKQFKKHTPPIRYIPVGSPHRD